MIDSANDHQRMLVLYHPPLNHSSFKKKYLAGMAYAATMDIGSSNEKKTTLKPATSETAPNVDTIDNHSGSNLEGSLEISFAKATKHACVCVVQRLDLDRVECNTDYCPCSSLSELLKEGNPAQKNILHSCHIYTTQWLLERDLSWRSGNLFVTSHTSWTKCRTATRDSELVKAIGAWSVDPQGDCASEILSSTGKVDTIPCDSNGLIDVRSLTPTCEDDTEKQSDTLVPKLSSITASLEVDIPVGSPVGCEVDQCASMEGGKSNPLLDDYSETTSDSDLTLVEEQAEHLLPFIVEMILARLVRGEAFVQTPGINSGSRGSTRADNATLELDIHTNGHNFNDRKRKRGHHDNDNDDENDSEIERGPPPLRLPNSMPLQDPAAKLACHFYILDPEKYCDGPISGKTYKTCPTGFKDSKDLRDHHKKKHCGPKYLCSRCHSEFQNAADKAAHENLDVRCERQENTAFQRERYILVGTTRRAHFDSMKKPRNHSHEEHWFDVWKIIFPGYQLPPSPYMPVYGFGAQFDRIAEEVIQTQVFAGDHVATAIENQREANFLRRFAQRLRERLLDEIQEGRFNDINWMLGGNSRSTEDHRSTTINSPWSNDQISSRNHLQVPPANSFLPRSANYPVNQVNAPLVYDPYQSLSNYQAPSNHLQNSQNSVISSQGNNSSSTYSGSAGLTQGPFLDPRNLQTGFNTHTYDSM